MASMHSISLLIIPLIFLLSSSFSTCMTPNDICNSTVNPDFCRSILPNNASWDIYDYCHFSFHQCSSTTKNFSSSVAKFLQQPSNYTLSTLGALEDCRELAEFNTDFVSRTIATLGSQKASLNLSQTVNMHTLLSAIVTNQQTCIEGLRSASSGWNDTTDLHDPISDCNNMYSLSLALFTRAWSEKTKRADERPTNGRKLLQAAVSSVVVNRSVTVNPDGTGDFTSITSAIDAAPNNTDISDGYFVIHVVAGVYHEYVNITRNKMNLMMIGDGINRTVITGNRSVGGGSTTFNSATFIVVGQGFVGVNMTIQNTAGAINNQAVALRSGADMSTFYRCSFEGFQDTLYTHSLRQFYRECDIYGTVDFIFGDAAVVLQNCNMYPTLPIRGQSNEVTAQGRSDPNENTGTSIQNCSIRATPELASSNFTTRTYLGRPWREYSRTVYIQTFMDSLINPAGWNQWSGDFALSTLYYAEYNNTGPGSNTTSRVTWPGYRVIDAVEAAAFTVSNFIAGDAWLPQTGVPYTGGLV